MVNPPLSGTRGTYTGNQILSPFDQPGPVTRSRSRSRNETIHTGTDDKTPHRLPFGSTDSNSSASSSSTTSSARSDTSGDNQGREGTPITPPSDYGEDVKGLKAPPYAADLREVPTLLLPSRGLSGESSGNSNRSREVPRPSTPQPTEDDEDPRSTRSTSAITRGLGFVEIHDESPTVRRVRTLNLKKLADAAKAAKAAEAAEEGGEVDEDEHIAGISEALGALGLDSDGNDTESTQEPEETDEAVVSGASHGPQPEHEQQTSFDAADSSSLLGEDRVSSFPSSETAVLHKEVEQSDAATTPTTRSLTSTSIPNSTAESALEDGLDATASSDVNRQADFNKASGSTSVETVTPPRDPQNGESRRFPKVKENAVANEAAAKKAAVKEAREKDVAAKKEAREKEVAAKKEARKKEVAAKKEAREKEAAAKRESREKEAAAKRESREREAAAKRESREKEAREKEAAAKKKASMVPTPIFFGYNERKLTGGGIRDKILKIVKENKTKSQDEGYLYIYRSPKCPNHVKIGMTIDTPDERIDKWRKCELPIARVQDDKCVPFLHARLAENLILLITSPVALSLLCFVVFFITCLAIAGPKQPNEYVWKTFVNDSGWSDGVVFLTGLVNPNFMYSGLDGAIHLAEDCINASTAVPQALMATIVIGFVTTFAFVVAMFYCISDFDAVLGTPTAVPIYEIWNQATKSGTAATIFIVFLLLTGVFALNASQQTASRLTFSFARDDALIFSRYIGQMHQGLGVPPYALFFNAVVVFIIGCIYLGSTTAFSAIIGTGLVLQQLTFAIPAALLMFRGRAPQYLPSSGRWNLGKFGWFVNGVTVAWSALQLVLYNLPLSLPVTGLSMNYTCAVLGCMAIFALVNWVVYARRHYAGPKIDLPKFQ